MTKVLCMFLLIGAALAVPQDYSPTNYNAGDSGRSESVSPDGTVQGQYSYTDPNGKLITVKYRAGKDGFQVEGDHLPKSPSVPQQGPPAPNYPQQHHQQAPTHAPNGYNPFHNPNVPAHLYQAAPTHPPQQAAAPTHAPNGYNPFHNPHVPAHLYQAAPTHPPPQRSAPTHAPNGYNPFHNPNVPTHLYQAAPTHPPPQSAAPTHAPLPAPGTGYNPFYNPDIQNYNPLHNPHVPAHLYANAPQGHQQQQHQPAQHHQPAPANGGAFPAGTFGGHGANNPFGSFGHPNALPQTPFKNGGGSGRVSVSQQNNGFNYSYNS